MINNQCANNQVVCLVLDNIRSVYNVGSIFRTAETLGVSKIYCVGTTPVPLDRFDQKRKDFVKVALGAEDLILWEHTDNTVVLVKRLKKEGFRIIALEQTDRSIDYKKIRIHHKDKVAIILGNEVNGISKSLLGAADIITEIPMRGEKESLNVSVAAGIVLFRLLD